MRIVLTVARCPWIDRRIVLAGGSSETDSDEDHDSDQPRVTPRFATFSNPIKASMLAVGAFEDAAKDHITAVEEDQNINGWRGC